MADPPVPTQIPPIVTQENIANINAGTQAVTSLSQAMGVAEVSAHGVKSSMDSIKNTLQSVSGVMSSNTDLVGSQIAKFGLLTTTLAGTRDAFKNMGGFDTTGINTFGEQFSSVINMISKGDNAISGLTSFAAKAFGQMIPSDKIKQGLGAVIAEVNKMAANFIGSADNGIKLQNAFIQMSASTGTLGKVLKAAGGELQNMNGVLSQQQNMLNTTARATLLSADDVEKYYVQLGKIPGALTSVVKSSNDANSSTSMLTATILLAKGSGMSYQNIMTNLSSAFKSYGATGETALKFTARMSELSQNYGVELDDIQGGLKASAEAFKLYGSAGENAGRALEGTVQIMNNYIGALKESGISGAESVKMITHMTEKLGGLDLAQKSFLSSQSGGPGGLRGAYVMERQMREDPAKAMESLRTSMMKQFGSIVTRQQAETSDAAAAQYTKQTLMLQQGPYGALAKDQQSAEALLAAFDKRGKGTAPITELKKDIVSSTMETGVKFQETTATEVGKIRQLIDESKGTAGIANLGLVQKSLGTRTGTTIFGQATLEEDAAQRQRRAVMERGRIAGGEGAVQYSEGLKTGNVSDITGNMARKNIDEYGTFFKELSVAIGQPISVVKQTILGANAASAQNKVTSEQYLHQLDVNQENLKRQMLHEKDVGRKRQLMAEITEQQSLHTRFSEIIGIGTQSSGEQVRGAIPGATRSVNTAATTAANAAEATRQTTQQAAGTEKHEHHVFVQGICIRCHREMERQSDQARVNTPQQ